MKIDIKNKDGVIIPNLAILGLESNTNFSAIKIIVIVKNSMVYKIFYDKISWEQDKGQFLLSQTNQIIIFENDDSDIANFIDKISTLPFFLEVTDSIVLNKIAVTQQETEFLN